MLSFCDNRSTLDAFMLTVIINWYRKVVHDENTRLSFVFVVSIEADQDELVLFDLLGVRDFSFFCWDRKGTSRIDVEGLGEQRQKWHIFIYIYIYIYICINMLDLRTCADVCLRTGQNSEAISQHRISCQSAFYEIIDEDIQKFLFTGCIHNDSDWQLFMMKTRVCDLIRRRHRSWSKWVRFMWFLGWTRDVSFFQRIERRHQIWCRHVWRITAKMMSFDLRTCADICLKSEQNSVVTLQQRISCQCGCFWDYRWRCSYIWFRSVCRCRQTDGTYFWVILSDYLQCQSVTLLHSDTYRVSYWRSEACIDTKYIDWNPIFYICE